MSRSEHLEAGARRLSVALLCDYREEEWRSMDYVGEMLLEQFNTSLARRIEPTPVVPEFQRRAVRVPFLSRKKAFTADRALNRMWDYPRFVSKLPDYDILHVVDHSYSHLLNSVPGTPSVVTCHDLDAFRALTEPEEEPRSAAFRWMVARLLKGLRRATHVTCDTSAVRDEVLRHTLLSAQRVTVVHNGVHPSCSAQPDSMVDAELARLLGEASGSNLYLMHVGTTIQRKNIDLLLRLFAGVCARYPGARLIRVGGPLTLAQQDQARVLGIEGRVLELPFLSRAVLAAAYRKAHLVLQPSLREGFGLPVAEAMACGTPVVASDIPVLREVGGNEASYCNPTDVDGWVTCTLGLLEESSTDPVRWQSRQRGAIERASQFSWAESARKIADVYDLVREQHGATR